MKESHQQLKIKLIRLRLPGMLDTLEDRFKQAMKEKWSYQQFFELILQDEIDRRDHCFLTKRFAKSGLEPTKTMETFDFDFNNKIHAPLIKELCSCDFIKKFETIAIVGPCWVGKSHLAQAIGHEAIRKGYDVLFYRTHQLFQWIQDGRCDGKYEKRLSQIIKVPVLILDDFGLQTLNEAQQNDLYEVICQRYEKSATIITSNREFGEWLSIFNNQLLGSAAIDRLIHRATSIVIEGKSYRAEQFIQKQGRLKGNCFKKDA